MSCLELSIVKDSMSAVNFRTKKAVVIQGTRGKYI